MYRIGVVIPAAGKGLRLGGSIPKQFLPLKGTPVIERTIALFESLPAVSEIVVVVSSGHLKKVRALVARAGFRKVSNVVLGGKTRQESVWHGLQSFGSVPEIVMVHDAVRPCVTKKVVNEVIRQSRKHGAAVVGVRVTDTIKVEKRKGFYTGTPDRSRLWAVQTPQGFRYDLLVSAHKRARKAGFVGTDEASLVEQMKIPVKIVEGDYHNVKITTKEDLLLAESFVR
jgi:2-C-methyl-D-erythritol 4-phosphate cytidylyltransferase